MQDAHQHIFGELDSKLQAIMGPRGAPALK